MVDLDELVVPVRHYRISPVDDPAEATVLNEHVLSDQVAVDEDVVEPSEPGKVALDLRDRMRRQRAPLCIPSRCGQDDQPQDFDDAVRARRATMSLTTCSASLPTPGRKPDDMA